MNSVPLILASVTSPLPNASGIAFTASEQLCFFCDRALSDPAVHWMGSTGDVYLHSRCVWPLFRRLARDVREIELIQQSGPAHVGGRRS